MVYAANGLIEASDYNFFINGAQQFNSYWGTGTGDAGYGQTPIGAVAIGNTVTASQWATLINNLNKAKLHQTGSATAISAVTAGQRIDFISALSSQINIGYLGRLSTVLYGPIDTGILDVTNWSVGPTSTLSAIRDINVIFGDSDQARYFFNSGGYFDLIISATDNSGSARSSAIVSCVNSIQGIGSISYASNSGRTGTGNTVTQYNLDLGYYNLIYNNPQRVITVNSSSGFYTSTYAAVEFFAGDPDTTRGSKGRTFCMRVYLYAPADDVFSGSINLNLGVRCAIRYPETVYLTNSWGTPTVTFDSV